MNIYTVYKITNLINQKIYIGQTSKTAEYRLSRHIYGAIKYPNSHFRLSRAIKKHGPENFIVEVLYQSRNKNHIVNEMEDFFIQLYGSMDEHVGYNMAPGGQGGDIKSKEQKRLLSEQMKINNPSHCPEVRRKISKSVTAAHKRGDFKNHINYKRNVEASRKRFIENNPGKNKSPETLEKLSRSQKERYRKDPSKFVSGKNHYLYGTRGVFYSQDEEWQSKQRERSSNLRNSEVHQCSICDRTIKTNANFYKHLRIKHDYTDKMIESVRTSLIQKSTVP